MKYFTVEEINLIGIYKANTRKEQIQKLRNARHWHKQEKEMLSIFDAAIDKLERISDIDFSQIEFIPVIPVQYSE